MSNIELAREIAAQQCESRQADGWAKMYRSGEWDNQPYVEVALAAFAALQHPAPAMHAPTAEACCAVAGKLMRFDRRAADPQQRARADAFHDGQRHAVGQILMLRSRALPITPAEGDKDRWSRGEEDCDGNPLITIRQDVAEALMTRLYEVVHHQEGCKSIGGAGDKDCTCDAVPVLREMEALFELPVGEPPLRSTAEAGEEADPTYDPAYVGKALFVDAQTPLASFKAGDPGKRIQTLIPTPEWKAVAKAARHRGISLSLMTRIALRQHLAWLEAYGAAALSSPDVLAECREVLEWYREQARLCRLIHSEGDAGRHALAEDGGKRAGALLAKIDGAK